MQWLCVLSIFKKNFNEKCPPPPPPRLFWKYIKICFSQPRRTLRNNLAQAHFDMEKVPENYLKLRSQQMSFDQLLELWKLVK